MPLLVFSVVLFGVAAWLFIDPKPGLTIDQKIETAAEFLRQERPEAAIEYLNRLLAKEKLEKGPSFRPGDAPEFDTDYGRTVYDYYGVRYTW